MISKIGEWVGKYIKSYDIFKVSYSKQNALEYWKRIEGIDQPVMKKRR